MNPMNRENMPSRDALTNSRPSADGLGLRRPAADVLFVQHELGKLGLISRSGALAMGDLSSHAGHRIPAPTDQIHRACQEKLAEVPDMHRTYLAGIERALRNPSLENLVKLANALESTMSELFAGAEARSIQLPTRKGKS
jgi:DNA-binding XRE family transcriptional regulator